MQTLAVTSNYTLALAQNPEPEMLAGGAIIQTLACGLCGSDVDKLFGKKTLPGKVLGHEVVGTIVALDSQYQGEFKVNDRVVVAHHVPCLACHYCNNGSPSMCKAFKESNLSPGGFAQRFGVSKNHLAHTAFLVPAHISNREAICIEPLACVLRAVDRLPEVKTNPSAAVIGLGFIGMLTAQALQLKNYQVFGVDLKPERLFLAKTAGYIDAGWQPTSETPCNNQEKTDFLNKTPVNAVDTVVLTVMNPHTVALALQLVRDGGSLLILSASNPQTPFEVDLNPFYFREINVITSYSPSLESLNEAARLVFSRKISLTPLLTHPVRLSTQNPEAANLAVEDYKATHALKVIYEFDFEPEATKNNSPQEALA